MANNSYTDSNVFTSTTSAVCFAGSKPETTQGLTVSLIIEGIEEKMKTYPPGKALKTNTFSLKDTSWYFKLFPNGLDEEEKGFIALGVFSENKEPVKIQCECNGGKNNQGYFKSANYTLKFIGKEGKVKTKFLSHKIVLEKKQQLMSRGTMEFLVKVSLHEEGTPSEQVSLMEDTSEINLLRKLSENFSKLLLDEKSSDFQIICGDDKFSVHSSVLKARSSFFNGLFSNDFAENKTGHIVIDNVDSDTVRSLLEYIYTGRIKGLDSKPTQLLKAADMYDLPLLRKSCEDELISTMNLDNVVDLFVLAEDHNAVELRVAAKKMILENKAAIVKQDGWHTKLGTLVIELFEAI